MSVLELSHLQEIIPGTEKWREFKPNRSERFEGRVSMVEIVDNKVTRKSVFLRHGRIHASSDRRAR